MLLIPNSQPALCPAFEPFRLYLPNGPHLRTSLLRLHCVEIHPLVCLELLVESQQLSRWIRLEHPLNVCTASRFSIYANFVKPSVE